MDKQYRMEVFISFVKNFVCYQVFKTVSQILCGTVGCYYTWKMSNGAHLLGLKWCIADLWWEILPATVLLHFSQNKVCS